MTPPTFWRRKSQRPPSPLPPSEREPLLAPSSSHPSSSGRPLSHASSNATIRIDYDHDQQRQSSQAEAGRERPGALLYRLIYSTDPRGNRSTPYLIILTLSLLGAQMAWSLELSYGTPYLLSLGLSPQVTSLVWLAGPLSGLIAQPVVGCLSDASNSEFRRRYYMLVSTLFILLSTLALAFAQPVSEALVDLFALGLGDWDPVREARVGTATRTLAVISFWILDFALNGLQASGRALVLDRLNGEEMDSGNAWLGRMTHIGNILGYSAGYLDLSRLSILSWLGGDQFRRFAMIAILGLVLSVGITSSLITESYSEASTFSSTSASYVEKAGPSFTERISTLMRDMRDALRRLPRPIRRVCLVQLFAFMGWFPFLFFATTYIGTFETPGRSRPERERRERRGTEGMLLFAFLSLVFGTLFPLFSLASPRPSDPTTFKARLRAVLLSILPSYPSESSANDSDSLRGRGLPLRTFWTLSSLVYALLMSLTFFVSTSNQAILLVGAVGISWAIASWVPFALVMAFVKDAEEGNSRYEFEGDFYSPGRTRERRRSRRESATFLHSPPGEAGEVEAEGSQVGSSPARNQLRDALGECGKPLWNGSGEGSRRSASNASSSTIRNGASSIQQERSRRSSRLGSGSYIARGADVVREQPLGSGSASSPGRGEIDGRRSILEAGEDGGFPANGGAVDGDEPTKGGTILGIHNVAIVLPQFVVSIISSIIFKHFNSSNPSPASRSIGIASSEAQEGAAPGVVWVLRFGGLASLVAAMLTRFVPLTKAERKNRYGPEDEDEEDYEEGDRTIGEEEASGA